MSDLSDDMIRCLILGSVWLACGAILWLCGSAAKLGGPEDADVENSLNVGTRNEKSRACDPALDSRIHSTPKKRGITC